jgi:hypothetical protein
MGMFALAPALLAVAPCLQAGPVTAPPQQPQQAPHWAYVPPVRPVPPRDDILPIDAFVQARLDEAGVAPSPRAAKETLIRRLSLDLIGLPPTLDEIDAFVADARADAYEQLVDRLLASPHYGERWAVPWLDLARYGDSNGFNFDAPRKIWPWRDWVVRALNDDMPYDRFTVLQLAGDLLAAADDDARIATGFHRNTMLNNEGGVDADEARWERLLDRAATTATVWLGSTFRCAQCHDHKYDPISQRDFYALVAFFEPAAEVDLATGGTKTMVLQERADVAAATVLRRRGSYDLPDERVAAGTPAALHGWPAGEPHNRLGLAHWLASPQNPLFARVHVNRLWAALFGAPLCETPEDFGHRAPPPLHRELLDWLAVEFAQGGWSQKRLLRTIVLSATYQRSAAATATQRERDPQNRLWSRGARFRLDAEFVRDVALACGGLLSPKIGGPPVFPLQADISGIVPTNKVDLAWNVSAGDDRWRRSLYTYWRRTAPFVQNAVFDAPSREQCTVQRPRTDTPLQALVGLNDPGLFEAAQALGRRMQQAPGDERARLAFGFRLCTARPPTARELDRLQGALAAEPAAMAWTMVANALLNLDETLCRG